MRPPLLIHSGTEIPRAFKESFELIGQYREISKEAPKGSGPVICVPGYGTGDAAMLPLRRFLKSLGYTPLRANIGFNLESADESIMSIEDAVAYRIKMAERLKKRIEDLHTQHEENISLIGWSMGGLFALDVSDMIPDKITQVITLGSPFGDPRGTALFKVMRALKRNNRPVEEENFDAWLNRRKINHSQFPVTVIYSDKDGIVGQECSQLCNHERVTHIEVGSSHIGFVANPKVYRLLARKLNEHSQTD